MVTRELEDLRAYREKLRAYSTEELEDIYFHIDILRHPLRYRVLKMELESRRMQPPVSSEPPHSLDLKRWLESRPALADRAALRSLLTAVLLLLISGVTTFGLFSPMWLFAGPLHFTGIQTAIVYVACAPLPVLAGTALGIRIGGRGLYALPVLSGVLLAVALFDATGTPAAILRMILRPQPIGGGFLGGF